MTSGNLSDEPICYDDADARQRLRAIADAWLLHDRPIHVPCDDSVVRVVDGDELPIRRSRGYAPLPMRLPFDVAPALAVGGELKNTFCLATRTNAWMSQHIGDMGSVETLAAFERSTRPVRRHVRRRPRRVSSPTPIPATRPAAWAEAGAACGSGEALMVPAPPRPHRRGDGRARSALPTSEVIGFAFDGTGYGTDGAIWGGEVLVASYDGFERVAPPAVRAAAGRRRDDPQAAIAPRWRTCGRPASSGRPISPPFGVASERRAAPCCDASSNAARAASPRRAWAGSSTPSARCSGVRHVVSYEAPGGDRAGDGGAAHLDAARDYRFAPIGADRCRRDEIDPAPVVRGDRRRPPRRPVHRRHRRRLPHRRGPRRSPTPPNGSATHGSRPGRAERWRVPERVARCASRGARAGGRGLRRCSRIASCRRTTVAWRSARWPSPPTRRGLDGDEPR